MEDYNIQVGERIRKCRKAKKISMKELGKRVDLHESTISRYEKGEIQTLDIDKLKEFAYVLNVPTSYLLGWEQYTEQESFLKQWNEGVGSTSFTSDEMAELITFAKYIISKRG